MRFTLSMVFIMLTFTQVNGQMDREEDDFMLEFSVNYVSVPDFGTKLTYGMQGELMITKHIGFQMSAYGSQDYVSFNGPALLVPLGILIADENSSARDVISLAEILFWACAVENPAVHIQIGNRAEIVTYVSFCRLRYWWNREQPFASSWIASGSIGFKFGYFIFNNWYTNLSIEQTRLYYSGRPTGSQLGISIGKVLKSQ